MFASDIYLYRYIYIYIEGQGLYNKENRENLSNFFQSSLLEIPLEVLIEIISTFPSFLSFFFNRKLL